MRARGRSGISRALSCALLTLFLVLLIAPTTLAQLPDSSSLTAATSDASTAATSATDTATSTVSDVADTASQDTSADAAETASQDSTDSTPADTAESTVSDVADTASQDAPASTPADTAETTPDTTAVDTAESTVSDVADTASQDAPASSSADTAETTPDTTAVDTAESTVSDVADTASQDAPASTPADTAETTPDTTSVDSTVDTAVDTAESTVSDVADTASQDAPASSSADTAETTPDTTPADGAVDSAVDTAESVVSDVVDTASQDAPASTPADTAETTPDTTAVDTAESILDTSPADTAESVVSDIADSAESTIDTTPADSVVSDLTEIASLDSPDTTVVDSATSIVQDTVDSTSQDIAETTTTTTDTASTVVDTLVSDTADSAGTVTQELTDSTPLDAVADTVTDVATSTVRIDPGTTVERVTETVDAVAPVLPGGDDSSVLDELPLADDVTDALAPIVDLPAVAPVLDVVAGDGGPVDSTLDELLPVVDDVAGPLAGDVLPSVGGVVEAVRDVADTATPLVDHVTDLGTVLGTTPNDPLGPVTQTVTDTVQALVPPGAGLLSSAGATLGSGGTPKGPIQGLDGLSSLLPSDAAEAPLAKVVSPVAGAPAATGPSTPTARAPRAPRPARAPRSHPPRCRPRLTTPPPARPRPTTAHGHSGAWPSPRCRSPDPARPGPRASPPPALPATRRPAGPPPTARARFRRSRTCPPPQPARPARRAPAWPSASSSHFSSRLRLSRCSTTAACAPRRCNGGNSRSSQSSSGLASPPGGLIRTCRAPQAPGPKPLDRRNDAKDILRALQQGRTGGLGGRPRPALPAGHQHREWRVRHDLGLSDRVGAAPVRSRLRPGRRGRGRARGAAVAAGPRLAAGPGGRAVWTVDHGRCHSLPNSRTAAGRRDRRSGHAASAHQRAGSAAPAGSRLCTPDGSPRVRALQAKLTTRGLRPGPADGLFGPLTEAAVTRLQRSGGVPANGVVTTRTRQLLTANGGQTEQRASTQPDQKQGQADEPQANADGGTADGGQASSGSAGNGGDQQRSAATSIDRGEVDSSKTDDIALPLAILIGVLALAAGLLAGALLGRRNRVVSGTAVPLAQGVRIQGTHRSFGRFSGTVHALVLGRRGLRRTPEARYLVSDEGIDEPFWVSQEDVSNIVPPARVPARQRNGAEIDVVRAVGYVTVPDGEPFHGAQFTEQSGAIDSYCEQRGWELAEVVRDVEGSSSNGLEREGCSTCSRRSAAARRPAWWSRSSGA